MKTWSKGTVYLAVVLSAAGFLLIVLGWNGAAGKDFVQGQFPYVISGGIAGIALVMAGLTMALVQELRKHQAETVAKLDELVDAIVAGGGVASGGPTAVPADGDKVVAGRTTYHVPSCHLVDGRSDLQIMGTAAAKDRGLAPCRICEPQSDSA
ncbi:MAG TPA: hypothetical protein VGA69_02435 [Nitriliruptorales bacterium]